MGVEKGCLRRWRAAKPPERFPQALYWGIIVLGLTLHVWVQVAAIIIDGFFFNATRAHIAFAGLPHFLVHPMRLVLDLWLSLPFICLAIVGRQRINATLDHDTLYCKAMSMIGAGVIPLALCVGLYRDIYRLIGTEPEFGMGLGILAGYLIIGVYSFASMPMGYLFGRIVGKSLLLMRRWHRKPIVPF